MSAAILTFVPMDKINRAVTVLDIALGRGLSFDRALFFAVESLGQEPRTVPSHVWRLIANSWKRRSDRPMGEGWTGAT
jgi:hypothetical protein